MNTEICFLENKHESLYEEFILKSKNSILYHSVIYKKFLGNTLPNTVHKYIIVIKKNKVIASFPCVIKLSEKGNILNSLPFFGSHGSLLGFEKLTNYEVKKVFSKLNDLIIKYNILSTTIVDGYNKNNYSIFNKFFKPRVVEKRISQITDLSHFKKFNKNDISYNLLNYFEGKRRTDIRKGIKNKFNFSIDNSLESLENLFKIHVDNIKILGGVSKDWKIFKSLYDIYIKNNQCNIFTLKDNNKIICSLLLIYFKDTVYYFIPGVLNNYKPLSVMSSIIFYAMIDSINKGYSYWDWGGSWISQESLIKFKSSWKSNNKEYSYYINYSKLINSYSKDEILNNYKYFYVRPFKD
jgi:lipid II:glycine glycyltransferase (peptidoglycan interpeptide bridge formation enzyme)